MTHLPHVILVDEHDQPTGTMEKMEAHRQGLLHRAFSVFVLNEHQEMLLQQRAPHKYHSGGLWTNACCSHPMPGELVDAAAHRRLGEELGIDCYLTPLFSFSYRTDFDNGLTEHEFDHVLLGHYSGPVTPDPEEVASYRYLSFPEIDQLLESMPAAFTSWFHLAYPMLKQHLATQVPVNVPLR